MDLPIFFMIPEFDDVPVEFNEKRNHIFSMQVYWHKITCTAKNITEAKLSKA